MNSLDICILNFQSTKSEISSTSIRLRHFLLTALLVSVVVAEAADVVGGDVMDGAQHVLPILNLQITNQIQVFRSRDHNTGQTPL